MRAERTAGERMLDSLHSIKCLGKNIFWVEFDNHYDMTMHMLRVQEYYESTSDEFRGKPFSLVSYMRWYSMTYGDGVFTYTDDFCGFNVLSADIFAVLRDRRDEIPDWNEYDDAILAVSEFLEKIAGPDFYMILTVKDDEATFKHEYAHALYSQSGEFRESQDFITKRFPPKLLSRMKANLSNIGYAERVHFDEIQAILSTEDEDDLVDGLDKKGKKLVQCSRAGYRANLDGALERIRHLFPPRV